MIPQKTSGCQYFRTNLLYHAKTKKRQTKVCRWFSKKDPRRRKEWGFEPANAGGRFPHTFCIKIKLRCNAVGRESAPNIKGVGTKLITRTYQRCRVFFLDLIYHKQSPFATDFLAFSSLCKKLKKFTTSRLCQALKAAEIIFEIRTVFR